MHYRRKSPTILANGRYILSSTGQASPINDLVGLLEFTEDELLRTQKGLDAAGITLPNFKNVSRELAKEPTPEPEETEEQRIDRELTECEDVIVELQAVIRGVDVRDRLRRMKNRLRRAERGIIGLQSIAKGQMVRSIFEDHLQHYRASVEWVTMVPPWRFEMF
jgi:Ras GTPase-activating-like protein IQGAP2/3